MTSTLVIGDSLGVGTVPYLKKTYGSVDSDVVGGRSSANGILALKSKLRGGSYGRIVLDLGTNDTTAAQLLASVKRARRLAPDAEIYLPTLNGPFATREKNQMLRRLAASDPNVHLVPWAKHSKGNLSGDGIHATGTGYQARARLIAHALGQAASGASPVVAESPSYGGAPRSALLGYFAQSHSPDALINLAHALKGGG